MEKLNIHKVMENDINFSFISPSFNNSPLLCDPHGDVLVSDNLFSSNIFTPCGIILKNKKNSLESFKMRNRYIVE